ncbi:MAG: transcriptional regulator, AraC family protein, partial [Paenibacillus sp.]|nr:transcriptional regulator, AraC family protein [Paenibacillus sp.]
MSMEISISNTSHTLQVVGCQFGVKSADWSYPRHHHHLFELCYCWEGAGELTVGEETIVL